MTITQRIKMFFKEVFVEMKRVSWLSKNDVVKYTLIVLGLTIAMATFLGGLDWIFGEKIVKWFVYLRTY